jgi:hypothetical protein
MLGDGAYGLHMEIAMRRRRNKARYCGPCDRWVAARHVECPYCGADTDKAPPDDRDYADAVDSGMGGDALTLERDR